MHVKRQLLLASFVSLACCQQQCYYGPGSEFRGPDNLVPCSNSGTSSCCLLGDLCFPGGVCWNDQTGDTYQYGCTDITYQDATCPYKCGWNATYSPWTAIEYCQDLEGVSDTWVCQSPESCDCDWESSWALQVLPFQGCKAMGSQARVALYAPPSLAPYASLPQTFGGKTGYFVPTVVSGTTYYGTEAVTTYTPPTLGPLTSYSVPNKIVELAPGVTPQSTSLAGAHLLGQSAPSPTITIPTDTSSTSVLPTTSFSSITSSATSSSGSASASTSPTSTGSAQTSSTSSASDTSNASGGGITNDSSSNGLSESAKIGIGVGVSLGVLFLAGGGFFLFWLGARERQRRNNSEKHQSFDERYGSGEDSLSFQRASEMNGPFEAPADAKRISELDSDSKRLSELPTASILPIHGDRSGSRPPELDGETQLYELSSDSELRPDVKR